MATATATSASKAVFVQQTFDWDSDEATVAVSPVAKPLAETRQVARPSAKPKIEVPKYSTTSSTRRNRCEHVGGVMSAVLGKYGLSIDDLINAIEESRG